MDVFIYALSDPRTNEIRYVGKTVNMRSRLHGHIYDDEKTHKSAWIKSLKAKGLKPTMEVLESFFDEADSLWQESERWWISYLRFIGCPLTNLDSGGNAGKRMSDESKEKVRQSKIGIPRSEECKRKLRLANLGKKQSAELVAKRIAPLIGRKGHPCPDWLKKKLRQVNTGRKISDETRKKMSKSQIGRKHSEESKLKRRVSLTGKKRTPEQIERIRNAQIGKILTESHKSKILAGLIKHYEA